jgi:6-phosphogluconolactonase
MIFRLLPTLLIASGPLNAVPVFIGTNTGGKSASKGIYQADFDPATGTLSAPVLAAEYNNPGFLARHPTQPLLYACGQPKTPFADGASSVAAFAIEKGKGLKFLGEASSGGKGACHVAVDGSGRTVAIANYGDGTFSTVRLNEDGSLGSTGSLIASKGSGPNKSRQEGPHAHGVYFDRANRHLFVPDLGLDQVLVYPFDAATSKLGEPLPALSTAPGAGPRHLAFSPDEKHAYVINELNNTVDAASYADGEFKMLGSLPSLPADFTGNSSTSEIEVHPNGNFVYGSNRGHDSIVVYRRDATSGALEWLQSISCGGKVPRHFKIDPSGKWLLCGLQNDDAIRVLALDPTTGLLGEAGAAVAVPSPICILFAP